MNLPSLPLATLLLCTGLTPTLRAERVQTADAPWRTLTTAHYRINYPDQPAFRDFARHVAGRIEGIHALLEKEVGHGLAGPTDVLILNPMAAANGMVMPDLNRPTVTLWTQPLDSDTEISHSADWIDLLVLHELVHLHHLTWPNRSPTFLERLPSSPKLNRITQKAPGWITEGYATLLEGRLTGEGRPHGAMRASVLRQLAREGRLPSYRGLSGVDLNVKSGIRYQGGSAFMEWLQANHPKGHQVWPDLWARMASRRYKTFHAAFKATFGDEPEPTYRRWTAELTHGALEVERRVQAQGLREGSLFAQAPGGWLSDLSVSPDGSRLLARAITGDSDRRGLQIYNLLPDNPQVTKNKEAADKARAKDPDLAPETAPTHPLRTPEHTLAAKAFAFPDKPRWGSDGLITFETRVQDESGVSHPALDTWKPVSLPVRKRVIEPVHPVKQGRGWAITLAGRTLELPFEPFGPVAYDAERGLVYAATPLEGIYNLVSLTFDPATGTLGPLQRLTRTASAAFYPAPTPDGKALYYCQMSARGTQIRKLDLDQAPLPGGALVPEPTPFVKDTLLSRADEPSRVPASQPVGPDQPYDLRQSHVTGLRAGFVVDPSQSAYLLGAGGTDVLGRLNWTALGSIGLSDSQGRGPRGAMAGAAWRGTAWAPSLQVFSLLTKPSTQRFLPVEGMDRERRGAELGLTREWFPTAFSGKATFSAAREHQEALRPQGQALDRSVFGMDLRQSANWNQHLLSLGGSARAIAQSGRTDGATWSLSRLQIQAAIDYDGWGLVVQGEEGRIQGHPTAADRFSLGSQSVGLMARSLEAQQVFQAALPAFSATGDRFRSFKADFGGLYFQRVQLWNEGQPKPEAQRVAGFEMRLGVEDMAPWMRSIAQRHVGRLELNLGVHRTFDGVMKNRTLFTAAMGYRF